MNAKEFMLNNMEKFADLMENYANYKNENRRIDVNTTSTYSTHFLRAVELIEKARKTFNIPSENWPYPTKNSIGSPDDNYYAEIWSDGMDWQSSYWIIETVKGNDPVCLPFLIFEDVGNQVNFKSYDFNNLIKASLYERRDRLWIKQDDGCFNDLIWAYFYKIEPEDIFKSPAIMKKYMVEHSSQPRVQFYMNIDFVPERKK